MLPEQFIDKTTDPCLHWTSHTPPYDYDPLTVKYHCSGPQSDYAITHYSSSLASPYDAQPLAKDHVWVTFNNEVGCIIEQAVDNPKVVLFPRTLYRHYTPALDIVAAMISRFVPGLGYISVSDLAVALRAELGGVTNWIRYGMLQEGGEADTIEVHLATYLAYIDSEETTDY